MNPSEVLASGRKRPQPHHFRLVLSRLHENSRLTLQAATEERCHLSAAPRGSYQLASFGQADIILCESCSSDGQTDYETQPHSHA